MINYRVHFGRYKTPNHHRCIFVMRSSKDPHRNKAMELMKISDLPLDSIVQYINR